MNNLEEYHATVDNVKKWDSVDQISSVIQHLNDNKDQIKSIELSGNSIGYEVAQELGIHISKLGNLTVRLIFKKECQLQRHFHWKKERRSS